MYIHVILLLLRGRNPPLGRFCCDHRSSFADDKQEWAAPMKHTKSLAIRSTKISSKNATRKCEFRLRHKINRFSSKMKQRTNLCFLRYIKNQLKLLRNRQVFFRRLLKIKKYIKSIYSMLLCLEHTIDLPIKRKKHQYQVTNPLINQEFID